MTDQAPSETTFLLPKRTLDTLEPPLGTLEPGDAPAGVLPSTDGSLTKYASISKGEFGDEESQLSEIDEERKVQFEGIPEVKSQLKWILPAVSIGVGTLGHIMTYNVESVTPDLPLCWGSDHYRLELWQNR